MRRGKRNESNSPIPQSSDLRVGVARLRNALTIAALAVWLAMVALLVRRQVPPASSPLEDLPPVAGSIEDDTTARQEWFGIHQGGRKIGWARRTVRRDAQGFTFRDDSSFTLAMLGVPQELHTSLEAETDLGYALRALRFSLASPATRFAASATTDGRTLVVRYGPRGDEQEATLELDEPIHLPATLRERLAQARPPDGTRFTATVFSPLTLRSEPLTLVVEGRERIAGPDGPVEALRIAEEHQGMRARAWLDADGSALREEAMLGFTLERASAEAALVGIDDAAPPDLAASSSIPLDGVIAEPRLARELALRISGPAAGRVPDRPPRQRVDGDRLRITQEAPPTDLPPGLPPLGADDPAVERFTTPSPFVESDDPAIVSTARAIVAGERDPARAARRILDWVASHLAQEPSLTVPSARQVLGSRRGDCNEHAVLLTALARAAGIPARVVAGVVYADGAFFYHAWSELWLSRWVSADAIFRQMPADATHIELIEGGPERHVALVEVIGQVSFAKLEGDP